MDSTPLPPHFSAAQIQAAMPVGSRLVFETTTADQPAVRMLWEVLSVDEAGGSVVIRYSRLDANGGVMDEPAERSHAWAELATHSSFPSGMTQREDGVSVTVPAGTYTCTRYTVQDPGGEVSVFDFADGLAGPPVQMVQKAAGQTKLSMVLVERSGAPQGR